MESETLFAEEAEPPGSRTGNGLQLYNEHVGTSLDTLFTLAAVPARPAPRLSAFSDSRTRAFRKRFFPDTTLKEWNDWHWQLRNRIRDAETLGRMIHLSEDELHAMIGA
ncbi:MAG: hypothetical protein Q8O11_06040, partial [Syntrophales bacterium]|nr:hypothetical protein [Syntrophales bacterium]